MLNYYQVARQASLKIDGHPGLVYLRNECNKHIKVLDVGCGEGSRLEVLTSNKNIKFGIDINRSAISLAKKNYPKSIFKVASGEKLPFDNDFFDLVYSAFTIEHVQNPEIIINEMLRVTSKNGLIVILAPNYGAPNRRSPNSIQNPPSKLLKGFFDDYSNNKNLNWVKVNSKKNYNQIDDDTTIEPYLYSLIKYIKGKNMRVVKYSSLWELEQFSLNPRKLVTCLLGRLGIFPFKYWGPQLFISFSK